MAAADLKERMRRKRVVVVIGKRIAHALGHDNRAGHMNDGDDIILHEEAGYEILVRDLALDDSGAAMGRADAPCAEIVEHGHGPAGLDQC